MFVCQVHVYGQPWASARVSYRTVYLLMVRVVKERKRTKTTPTFNVNAFVIRYSSHSITKMSKNMRKFLCDVAIAWKRRWNAYTPVQGIVLTGALFDYIASLLPWARLHLCRCLREIRIWERNEGQVDEDTESLLLSFSEMLFWFFFIYSW